MTKPETHPDSDAHKGAAESDSSNSRKHHEGMADQFPHRNSDKQVHDLADGGDTDFPEPGSNPEHSGQKHR